MYTKVWSLAAQRLLAGLLLAVAFSGCKDETEQRSRDLAAEHASYLSAVPQAPPTPTFDYEAPDPAPELDPLPEAAASPTPPTEGGDVGALVGRVRSLPAPAYRQVETYAQIGVLEGHRGAVLGLQVVGDEPRVVTHGTDATIRFWAPSKREATTTIKDAFAERAFASADGSLLLAERQGTVTVIDGRSGLAVGTLRLPGLMAVSHDGRKALAQGSPEVVYVVDTATGDRLLELRGHKRQVQCARFSADDRQIITGGDASDETVRVWDSSSGEMVARLQDPRMSQAVSVAISPNGRLIAAVERTKITLWDTKTSQIYRQIESLPYGFGYGGTYAFAEFLDGEGRRMAIAQGPYLAIIDVGTGGVIQTLKAHDTSIGVMDVSRDAARIVTGTSAMGGIDEPCKVWGAANEPSPPSRSQGIPELLRVTPVATIVEQRGGVGPLASSPDGKVVYAGTSNTALDSPGGMVSAYDPLSGRKLSSFDSQIPRRISNATSLAISLDGRLLAMGTNKGDIIVWETANGREIASNETYSREITGLTFLPDGKGLLVLARNEQVLPVLDATTGQEIRRIMAPGGSPRGLRALHDGSGILVGDLLLRLEDGSMVRRFESRQALVLEGLGASADGTVIAGVPSSQGGSELRVWATAHDSPSASKRIGEADAITMVRVSAGGRYVATIHHAGLSRVLTLRESANLIEVAKVNLDVFAAVADIAVDERTKAIAVSGSAQDGVLAFFKW